MQRPNIIPLEPKKDNLPILFEELKKTGFNNTVDLETIQSAVSNHIEDLENPYISLHRNFHSPIREQNNLLATLWELIKINWDKHYLRDFQLHYCFIRIFKSFFNNIDGEITASLPADETKIYKTICDLFKDMFSKDLETQNIPIEAYQK